MSTQALGAAAAGTAILGGGGATIAYAAGAFDPKAGEQKQEKSTYKTLAETDPFIFNKEYVGGDENAIKALLEKKDDTSYKTTLKSTHWEKMEEKDILLGDKPTKTKASEFDNDSKNDEISKYVSVWCQAVSAKELKAIPESREEDHGKWEAFKFVCFKEKTGK
ncbi:hypothetical protein [Candidatus Mycoplasma haematohominis]|uniref:Uncharacterized protein n=1 Tax=Candidatus Mycoplasma haematohominis TaxID=1494318 RepID=A0A478FQR2_9MOLU|nr:hypothetical protein [Candidatus Mycoplasma haemohominis]GCE63702.1 hypothetical protein MHSWG343_07020 [Candidatus Mycoplasma haemohominis]